MTIDTGRKVDFERDFRDRISAVIDPKGARIEYTYNASGDSVAVKDRVGDITQFAYDTTRSALRLKREKDKEFDAD